MKDVRIPLIKELIEAGHGCGIGPVLMAAGLDQARHCRGKIEGLHELRKRSAGGSLVNPDNLIPACNYCNGLVEDEGGVIRELTGTAFIVREGDPEWESLGKRQDPH